ncbi:hypothetical protein [Brevundimonas sp.]|uniref:hypothetical protein n=1 Tax=Brevundimonas sp. TaxID=1871086 RepID=UPI0025ED419A|nr:hypothetical protein [Brevundimonas sp.]
MTADGLSDAICILHYGRCGSTVLTRLLAQFGCVSLGEFLHPVSGQKYEALDGLSRGRGAANSSASVLDALARVAAARGERASPVLFEIKSLDFIREAVADGPETFVPALAERGASRCIHLERRDLLARLVSTTLASRTGVYHRTDEAERPEPFEIEPARAVAEIGRQADMRDRIRAALAVSGLDVLQLEYERDLMADPRVGALKAAAWLGRPAPSQGLVVDRRRTTPFPIAEVLSNHAEVVAALARAGMSETGARLEPAASP